MSVLCAAGALNSGIHDSVPHDPAPYSTSNVSEERDRTALFHHTKEEKNVILHCVALLLRRCESPPTYFNARCYSDNHYSR